MATRTTTRRAASSASSQGFTAEEKAAMKERARELKQAGNRAAGERALREKIAEMPDEDRVMAERVHEIITTAAPDLVPRTWYGMPAYAKGGKVICFFQSRAKFKARYATLGFNEDARLDDGVMWPTAFALTALTPEAEERIAALVRQAVG
jgi:uncharacterized protein YdhG (YjbR/CyaY superfamily)